MLSRFRFPTQLILHTCLLITTGSAQILVGTILRPPPTVTGTAGQCLVDVGDQDGDGVVDFAATEPYPASGIAQITVYSGSTRFPLSSMTVTNPIPGTTFSLARRTLQTDGDLNGDGRSDLAVRLVAFSSSSFSPIERGLIFDPLTGSQLWTSTSDGRITPIVDATGDGRMDLSSSGSTSIFCSSGGIFGPTGAGETEFWNVKSVAPNPSLTVLSQQMSSGCVIGTSLSVPQSLAGAFRGIRDANGDGRTDFFVAHSGGAGFWSYASTATFFAPAPPTLKIYMSSVSASGMTSYVDTATFFVDFVHDIISVTDMTGDGEVDACVVTGPGASMPPAHTLTFYSSQSATVFRTLAIAASANAVPRVIDVGDVDKDGVGDFAVEYAPGGTAKVQVYSGATATVLFDIVPPGAPLTASFGTQFESIAWLGDTDGDGTGELAVARNLTREIFIYSLRHVGVDYFGQGCGTTPSPEIGIGGNLLPNGTIRYNFSSAVPNSLGTLILGVSNQFWGSTPLPFDLSPIGLPGCNLLVSPDLFEYVYADALGAGGYSYSLPAAGVITGFTLYGQWFFDHPLGSPTDFGVSNGVEVVFP